MCLFLSSHEDISEVLVYKPLFQSAQHQHPKHYEQFNLICQQVNLCSRQVEYTDKVTTEKIHEFPDNYVFHISSHKNIQEQETHVGLNHSWARTKKKKKKKKIPFLVYVKFDL